MLLDAGWWAPQFVCKKGEAKYGDPLLDHSTSPDSFVMKLERIDRAWPRSAMQLDDRRLFPCIYRLIVGDVRNVVVGVGGSDR